MNNNNNDQVLDGYVIKLRLIVELHITHSRLEIYVGINKKATIECT